MGELRRRRSSGVKRAQAIWWVRPSYAGLPKRDAGRGSLYQLQSKALTLVVCRLTDTRLVLSFEGFPIIPDESGETISLAATALHSERLSKGRPLRD